MFWSWVMEICKVAVIGVVGTTSRSRKGVKGLYMVYPTWWVEYLRTKSPFNTCESTQTAIAAPPLSAKPNRELDIWLTSTLPTVMIATHYNTNEASCLVTLMGMLKASSKPTDTIYILRDDTAVISLKKHLLPTLGGVKTAIADILAYFDYGNGDYCCSGWGSKNSQSIYN